MRRSFRCSKFAARTSNRGALGAWSVIHARAGKGPTSLKPRPIRPRLVLGAPNFLGDVSMRLLR